MKFKGISAIIFILFCSPSSAQMTKLSPTDEKAAFKAAGYKLINKQWVSDCYDPDMPSSSPGTIEIIRDLNGDGRPEVVITEGGTSCHGNTGVGFSMVSKQANGSWKLIFTQSGIPKFLETNGNGWPDIEIGGPGFCTGVWGWNGNIYNYKCSREDEPGGCTRKGVMSICK